jgi:hypothetical protein
MLGRNRLALVRPTNVAPRGIAEGREGVMLDRQSR